MTRSIPALNDGVEVGRMLQQIGEFVEHDQRVPVATERHEGVHRVLPRIKGQWGREFEVCAQRVS